MKELYTLSFSNPHPIKKRNWKANLVELNELFDEPNFGIMIFFIIIIPFALCELFGHPIYIKNIDFIALLICLFLPRVLKIIVGMVFYFIIFPIVIISDCFKKVIRGIKNMIAMVASHVEIYLKQAVK